LKVPSVARARGIRDLNLARRVQLAGFVLAAVVAVAFVAFLGAVRAFHRDADQHARVTRAATAVDRVEALVVDLETGLRGFVLTDQLRFLEPWQAARKALPGATVELVRAIGSQPRDLPLARQSRRLALAYLHGYADPLVSLARRDRRNATRVIALAAGKQRADRVRRTLAQLSSALTAGSRRQDGLARASARSAQWVALGVGVGAIVLILLCTLYLSRAVSRPIMRIASATERFATSGLITVPERGISELRQLAHAFNVMAASRSAARQRLEERNAELDAVRAEAERANEAKTEFLSRTSHELRTPLNSILGFAQLMQMDESDPTRDRHISQVIKGGRHLLELIDELLEISRIESGELAISPEPVAVDHLLVEVVTMVEPLAGENGVRLQIEPCATAELYARADKQRLKQVLLNLLSNAIKYGERGGQATARCCPTEDGRVRLEVQDTGPGLSEAQQRRLFVPFERLGRESSKIEGTGLGLALALNLVRLMDGELTVTSAPGAGSTFGVVLPAAPDVDVGREPFRAPAVTAGGAGERTQCTILYIEDNVANYRLLEQALDRHRIAALTAAMQGSVGLELARSNPPDLILLDLHLPDMEGQDVLRALKNDARTAQVPVVILSADVSARQISALVDAGAHAYLTKPIDVALFLRTIETILHQPAPVHS
jgi:signal transduction histidine kinase/ActR/RegA family two-component response regulator